MAVVLGGAIVLGLACVTGCGDAAGPREAPGRVLLIGIDGASPRVLDPLLAAGRLPNLARLAAEGASGTIRSALPIDSPRIWNTIVTGKVPDKHGIQHFARQGDEGGVELYLSHDRKVHALWNIVSDAGMRVGVVNFWNTYPPELVDGVMVSDHLLARNIEGRLRITRAAAVPEGPVIHPESWHERLANLLAFDPNPTAFENPLLDPDLPGWFALVGSDLPRRFEEDGALTLFAAEIDRAIRPQLMMVLLPGIDRASHFLWGSIEDPAFYDEELRGTPEERAAAARALDRYYEYTDALIGVLLAGFERDDLVLVLSDHGFERGRGMGLLTGVHETEASVDGVAFARGHGIEAGSRIRDFSIVDVTPSVLAWLGLPVGEDMDGRPAAFLAPDGEAPVFETVPTHDTAPVARMELRPSGAESEIVEQLKQLGYIE